MEENNKIPFEAGGAIVDEGIRFKLPFFFWIKIPLTIRPLRPGTIVRISMEVLKMEKVSESENMIHEFLKAGKNLKNHAKIVALAALNNPVGIKLFSRLFTWLILWKVRDIRQLAVYVQIVYKQMESERFFFIMALTKGMNFLSKKQNQEDSKEEKPTGEL